MSRLERWSASAQSSKSGDWGQRYWAPDVEGRMPARPDEAWRRAPSSSRSIEGLY